AVDRTRSGEEAVAELRLSDVDVSLDDPRIPACIRIERRDHRALRHPAPGSKGERPRPAAPDRGARDEFAGGSREGGELISGASTARRQRDLRQVIHRARGPPETGHVVRSSTLIEHEEHGGRGGETVDPVAARRIARRCLARCVTCGGRYRRIERHTKLYMLRYSLEAIGGRYIGCRRRDQGPGCPRESGGVQCRPSELAKDPHESAPTQSSFHGSSAGRCANPAV